MVKMSYMSALCITGLTSVKVGRAEFVQRSEMASPPHLIVE